MKKLWIIGNLLALPLLADLSERDFINLTPKEQKDLEIAQKWINNQTTTTAGENGEIIFLFGESMPSIITAPLRLTNIVLEAGEIIKDVQIGDSVRWIVSLSISGEDPITSHIILKPTDTDLQTTLNIMTNRRVYRLNLISEDKNFMPAVAFRYPNDITNTLTQYTARLKKQSSSKNFYKTKDEAIPSNVENLDFGYQIDGTDALKPLRVYNDGIKTYIQMPKNLKFYEAPALMILDKKEKQIVNYRFKYDTYIVDRLFDKAILIANVGKKQQKVTITHKSARNNQEIVDNVLYDLSLQKGVE